MRRFKSVDQVQRFVTAHAAVSNLFNLGILSLAWVCLSLGVSRLIGVGKGCEGNALDFR